MPEMQQWLAIALKPEVALPIFLGGMLLAFWIGRRTGDKVVQLKELEGALDAARGEQQSAQQELGEYRGQVADHFAETSHKLHDLTLQYRAVYDHLAEGAGRLCPDRLEKLEGGLGLDALPEESAPPMQAADGALASEPVEEPLETDEDLRAAPLEETSTDIVEPQDSTASTDQSESPGARTA